MQYETESIGTREFYFNHKDYPDTSLVFSVDIQNTSQDGDLDDQGWGLLQKLMPTTWHDWVCFERKDII